MKIKYQFTHSVVTYHFREMLHNIEKLTTGRHAVIITDKNIAKYYKHIIEKYPNIIIGSGEKYKQLDTINYIIQRLIKYGADRSSLLVGMGGGVVTDITGYAGAIYMRGIDVGLMPASLLAMTDAAIGGKNGVDVGMYKNMVGTIKQPSFLFYATELLNTLPEKEWRNGFAEIIKHAAIDDKTMFKALEKNSLIDYRNNEQLLASLIKKNAMLKTKFVQEDEFEKGNRKLLNFGHTLGHAVENLYKLSHGEAISIGMHYATSISDKIYGSKNTEHLDELLVKYGLPIKLKFDAQKVYNLMLSDKKRSGNTLQYILLEKIGKGVIQNMPVNELKKLIVEIQNRK